MTDHHPDGLESAIRIFKGLDLSSVPNKCIVQIQVAEKCVRIFRNAASTGPQNLALLRETGVLGALANVLAMRLDTTESYPLATLQLLSMQTFANAAASSPAAVHLCWTLLLEAGLLSALSNFTGPVLDALCYFLFLCCQRWKEPHLPKPDVAWIIKKILTLLPQLDHAWDNLPLLIGYAVYESGLAEELLQTSTAELPCTCMILDILCQEAASLPNSEVGTSFATNHLRAMQHLGKLARGIAEKRGTLTSDNSLMLVRGVLALGRAIMARDDQGRGLSVHKAPLAEALLQAGFVELLLCFLDMVPAPRKDQAPAGELAAQHTLDIKTDVLAALANSLYQRKAVQEAVLDSGKLILILTHCQSDHDAPMAREWALLAVRNICEGNLRAQNDVGSLRKVQASEGSSQVLGGVQIVSDQALGKKVLKAVS
ncbi:CGL115 [Auxenochlorella protothecoides x Auxenochlorella symbiontica]